MKKLAKVLSLALVLVMVLSLGGNAWAENHTITIKVPTNDKGVHTFSAYQIFTGTIEQGDDAAAGIFTDETSGTSVYPDRTLFNAQWGSALTVPGDDDKSKARRGLFVEKLVDAFDDYPAFTALVSDEGGTTVYSTDAADVAEAIGTIGDKIDATVLSSLIARFIADNDIHPIKTAGRTSGAEQVALTELPDGYYFIEDTVASGVTQPYAVSKYILQLLSDVTLKSKTEVPSSNKKVDDKNDSSTSEDAVTWQDSADYDVGDTIPYKLTAFIPVNVFDTYDWYNLAFYDDMCDALDFNSDAKVTAYQIAGAIPENGRITREDRINGTALYLEDVDIDAETAIGDSSYTNGNKYRFDLGNMLAYDGGTNDYYLDLDSHPLDATAAYVVVEVAYTATLNNNAKINAAGNPNKSHIEFSNNPNDNTDKGRTPDDVVTVFTFKAVINKVDGNNQPLNTADFRFDKLLASYKVTADDVENKVYIVDGTKKYLLDKPEDGKVYVKTSKGSIIKVEESEKTSNGNTVVPLTVIAADDPLTNVYVTIPLDHAASTNVFMTHKIDAGTYQITETVTPVGYNPIEPFALELQATHDETADEPKLTVVSAQGWTLNDNLETDTYTVTKNVINRSGNVLPSTGGVGTTLFYVFGSMLVIAAAVYFVTKKRSEVE